VPIPAADAVAAYETGLDRFLRWRAGALDALDLAAQRDPDFVLAHCARAAVAWRMGRADLTVAAARQAVERADQARDERERRHVHAVDALQRGEPLESGRILAGIAAEDPTDRLAVRIVGLNCITQGDYRGGIDLARRSLAALPDEPQFLTMLGFFLEQSGDNDEGLGVSLRSLAKDPGNLYTYHAVGHAWQARGDYPNAVETFERAASLERYPHVLWHLAEAQALLGHTGLTRDYWGSTAPALPLYERVELLWRLEVLRGEPADDMVWRDLAKQAERVMEHADFQTTWMHHWIGVAFARAGEWFKADEQVARLRRLPAGRPSGHWSTLGASILEGEIALIRGDLATAARLMAPAIAQLDTMGGGSREQKDIFRDVFADVLRRLGRADEVIALAQARLLANPWHVPSLAALAWAYEANGDAALHRHACRQLVQRGAEAGLAGDAPELVAARQALAAQA
jgi:tetratricopeptide (TPR) repeat protein